jgi:hypothetical protein
MLFATLIALISLHQSTEPVALIAVTHVLAMHTDCAHSPGPTCFIEPISQK